MKIAIFTKDGALPRELGRFSGVDVYPITANGFTASGYDFIGVLGTIY